MKHNTVPIMFLCHAAVLDAGPIKTTLEGRVLFAAMSELRKIELNGYNSYFPMVNYHSQIIPHWITTSIFSDALSVIGDGSHESINSRHR